MSEGHLVQILMLWWMISLHLAHLDVLVQLKWLGWMWRVINSLSHQLQWWVSIECFVVLTFGNLGTTDVPLNVELTHNTGCSRNNSHILKGNKNQTKQGTQKILLFIKSTYDAIFFFQTLLKITSLKWRLLLMTHSWSCSRKLSVAFRVIAGGMAATSCRIASFNYSIVPGWRA